MIKLVEKYVIILTGVLAIIAFIVAKYTSILVSFFILIIIVMLFNIIYTIKKKNKIKDYNKKKR